MKSTFRFLFIAIATLFTASAATAQYGNLQIRFTSSEPPASSPASIGANIIFDKLVTFLPDPGYPPKPPIGAIGLNRSGSAALGATTTIEPAATTTTGYTATSSYDITDFRFRIGGFSYYIFSAAEITALQTFNNPIEVVAFSGKKFTVTKIYDISDIVIKVNYHL